MSYEDSVKRVFAQVQNVVDLGHGYVMGAVDSATVEVDKFLGEWEKRAVELARQKDGKATAPTKGEDVKVKPTVDVMRADIVKSFRNKGQNSMANAVEAGHDSADAVEVFWDQLLDSEKSWVVRDPNSPL